VVDLIGLDCGLVVLRRGDDWVPVSCYPMRDNPENLFSRSIVETVSRDRRTFYQEVQPTSSSLEDVSAVVASPILNKDQEVVGVVYGARRGVRHSVEISPLEAQLTQVLAATVAVGLARQQSDAEAARRRVQFEQFFTSNLALELDRDPALLDGREREISVLFADIRGFSTVSQKLSARLTCELIRDVMEHLTATIMAFEGVVVDYIGDGLLAMWNAPLEQPEHARQACRAALAMSDGLAQLNRRWEGQLGVPIGLGIGLNSGPALVGNTGSHKKFKYGPLGHTVNLASRVEGATKHLGVQLLITGPTRSFLGDTFAVRRLCRARLVGISGEVELHELCAESAPIEWQSLRDSYETALGLYETGRWREACQALLVQLKESPGIYDLPSISLLGRSVECLKQRPSPFDPVFEFKSK
jgi:adenylate cyclase